MSEPRREGPLDLSHEREPKRRAILEAASRLFIQFGFRKTSVEEIATAAGIGKGTVYLYFRDKDAIFLALLEAYRALIDEACRRAVEGDADPGVQLVALIDAKFGLSHRILQRGPGAREMLEATNSLGAEVVSSLTSNYRAILRHFIETKLLSSRRDGRTFDTADMEAVIFAFADGAMRNAVSPEAFDRTVRHFVTMLLLGLSCS